MFRDCCSAWISPGLLGSQLIWLNQNSKLSTLMEALMACCEHPYTHECAHRLHTSMHTHDLGFKANKRSQMAALVSFKLLIFHRGQYPEVMKCQMFNNFTRVVYSSINMKKSIQGKVSCIHAACIHTC